MGIAKLGISLGLASILVFTWTVGFDLNQAYAESENNLDFTVLTGNQLNSPIGQNILEKIELSKKILADLKAGKTSTTITPQQQFVEEQRRIAKERLNVDLERMKEDFKDFTPRAAYSKFLAGVNSTHHGIYWDQFNYLDKKVKLAKQKMNIVLEEGGTYQEAHREYVKYASMPRIEMIQVNQELNIKYGFADANVQKAFDKYGKLPRTED